MPDMSHTILSHETKLATSRWAPLYDSTGGPSRVVVGEYHTGVACAPCQAHEEAFDSLLHRYPMTQFITLAYHQTINFPIADPADSLYERMRRWYGFTSAEPGLLPGNKNSEDYIDGHATTNSNILALVQGQGVLASKFYRKMLTAVETELRKVPEAVLHVEARPSGGDLMTQVRVESLAPGHPDVYVRICVVEDTVLLKQALTAQGTFRSNHYMVVRSVAYDATHPMGLPLHGQGTVSYTFALAKEQQRLLHYWALGHGPVPQTDDDSTLAQIQDVKVLFSRFPDKQNWVMNPARLHVVAFVQDARTGDVLQAAMIPVGVGLRLQ